VRTQLLNKGLARGQVIHLATGRDGMCAAVTRFARGFRWASTSVSLQWPI